MNRVILLICFFYCSLLSAQDIHFSLFNMSPMTTNPAFTGAYEGTLRIGGLYRDQWRSVLGSNAFTTPTFYIDAPIIKGFRKYDWIGAGVSFLNDKAGSAVLQRSVFMGSVSYHLAFDKKRNTILTLGIQGGTRGFRIDRDALRFADGYDLNNLGTGTYNQTQSLDFSDVEEKNSNFDMGAGLMLKAKLNKGMDMNIGVGMFNLLRPDYGLKQGVDSNDDGKMPIRTIIHGQFNAELNPKWSMHPTFLFGIMASANEMIIQVPLGYKISEEKDITLKFGPGYRLRDAAKLILGVDYGSLSVGLAYDVNISSLNDASNYQGAFELGASYIIKIYKDPKVDPIIFCPRL